ncbi:hypothetical protein WMY93_026077 [Mugilogobius chulae]|uniref:OCEL domain-containing protein n=1 Tax=Mugilogobius chulae TaxID=88201 RepID=A0AAW0MWL8_9GOBI
MFPSHHLIDSSGSQLVRAQRLFQPQQNLLSVPEAQVSPLRDTPNSSPAHRPKHSLHEDYTDPLVNKRPRISHLSTNPTSGSPNRLRPDRNRPGLTENKNHLDPRKLFDSLSEMDKRLEPGKRPEERREAPENHQNDCDQPPSPLIVPDLTKPKLTRRKSKHKHKEKTVHNQIVQEYRKIKKSNPNYSQDKIRCEYLHSKLAHIKKLISEYDQQQMSADSLRPN